jgi:hypothetical protein
MEHTADGERLVEIPVVLTLRSVSTNQSRKVSKRTVTSRSAHWGTRVPGGTGLGKLGWGRFVRGQGKIR